MTGCVFKSRTQKDNGVDDLSRCSHHDTCTVGVGMVRSNVR